MGASNLKLILISSTWDCTTFHSFNVKKVFQKLAGLWLAGEVVNRMWIYGSKAEGLSSFQRRSCWVMQRRRICIAVFQITGNSVVCLTVCSSQQQITHQNFAILALYKAIHRRPVDWRRKGPLSRKTSHVIMLSWVYRTTGACGPLWSVGDDLWTTLVWYRQFGVI